MVVVGVDDGTISVGLDGALEVDLHEIWVFD